MTIYKKALIHANIGNCKECCYCGLCKAMRKYKKGDMCENQTKPQIIQTKLF